MSRCSTAPIEGLRGQGQAGLLGAVPPEASPGPAGQPLSLRPLRRADGAAQGRGVAAMPKRTDIKSILIIGAGPIVIGQACEFDYSGTQACKALKEEGYRVVLVNSNPATIMTDPELADATYIEPITPEIVAKIIEKERPDALLPTMGGQTALNTAMALDRSGVLEEVRRRDDRRQGRGDRQGRGPRAVPRGDDRRSAWRRPARGWPHRSLEEALAALGPGRPAGDHPPLLHPGRHRRRHRLQPRGVRGDRRAAGSTPRRPPRC